MCLKTEVDYRAVGLRQRQDQGKAEFSRPRIGKVYDKARPIISVSKRNTHEVIECNVIILLYKCATCRNVTIKTR